MPDELKPRDQATFMADGSSCWISCPTHGIQEIVCPACHDCRDAVEVRDREWLDALGPKFSEVHNPDELRSALVLFVCDLQKEAAQKAVVRALLELAEGAGDPHYQLWIERRADCIAKKGLPPERGEEEK